MFETIHQAICNGCEKREQIESDENTPQHWRLIRVETKASDTRMGSTGLYCTDCWKHIRRAMNGEAE